MRYPSILITLNGNYDKCETTTDKNIKVDWLELDLNSIFHPVVSSVYPPPNPKRLLSKKMRNTDFKEYLILGAITDRLDQIEEIIKPQIGIYYAVDGVCGLSKSAQQRKRRFKSKQSADTWDTNQISVGTQFMENLHNHLCNYIKRKKENEKK